MYNKKFNIKKIYPGEFMVFFYSILFLFELRVPVKILENSNFAFRKILPKLHKILRNQILKPLKFPLIKNLQ